MVGLNKTILRSLLILSYIVIIALIVYGISAVYSYLNTGADRSKMLHTEIKKIDQYLPKVQWAPLNNEGRPMDAQTHHDIENDYLDAWYIKHLAYKTNSNQGIDDYYTESAWKNLFDIIDLNASENITVESTTLEHHPSLEFFSEDGQLAVITDHNVVEFKRIYKDDTILLETTELASYKIILLLEDGFWRIRHMVKFKVKAYESPQPIASIKNLNIKGINYYPQATPWNMFGDSFDPHIISNDFKIIREAGLHHIRLFVPYEPFERANINKDKLKKLRQVLDLAKAHDLKVIVTLFDFYGDYSVLNWTLNQRHAETIVSGLKDHDALIAWDIKNEPDLDFKSRRTEHVKAWLNSMIDLVRSEDPEHPITIGWSNIQSASILQSKLDLITFHYYDDLEALEKDYALLKAEIPNKPIAITEYGVSSYRGIWNLFSSSEKKQAEHHKKVQSIFSKNDIPYMSWTLYDFTEIPKEVVGRLPWRKNTQKHFGFIHADGTKKASFSYISKE